MGKSSDMYADAAFDRQVRRAGLASWKLGVWFEEEAPGGYMIKEIRIQGPLQIGSGYRIILKVIKDGQKMVGWYNADDVVGLMAGLSERIQQNTLELRADTPWRPSAADPE